MDDGKRVGCTGALANAANMQFAHIFVYYKINSCTPLMTYLSYGVFGIFRFIQEKLIALKFPRKSGTEFLEHCLNPQALADLGIALIIYFYVKKKFESIKLGNHRRSTLSAYAS